MIKQVQIISVDKDRITAGCDRAACEGCKSSAFCRKQNTEFEVLNTQNLELKTGDSVEILMPAGRTVFATAMSLLFPLLCFLAALIITSQFFTENELVQLAAAALALLLGFSVSAIYFRLTKRSYMPDVQRKV